jgi:hypothetical protein
MAARGNLDVLELLRQVRRAGSGMARLVVSVLLPKRQAE